MWSRRAPRFPATSSGVSVLPRSLEAHAGGRLIAGRAERIRMPLTSRRNALWGMLSVLGAGAVLLVAPMTALADSIQGNVHYKDRSCQPAGLLPTLEGATVIADRDDELERSKI